MLLSMLYKARPDDLRLILVDPKMLELAIYEGIPHLLAPVVTDMKDAAECTALVCWRNGTSVSIDGRTWGSESGWV